MKKEFIRKLRGVVIGTAIPACMITTSLQGAVMVYANDSDTVSSSENIAGGQPDTVSEGEPEAFPAADEGVQMLTGLPPVANQIGGVPSVEQPSQETPSEGQPSEEVPPENQPSENQPSENPPAENVPSENQPSEEVPPENQPSENQPSGDQPAENQPSQELPSIGTAPEEAPSEGTPSEEVPAAPEVPAEEAPAEETPAEPVPEEIVEEAPVYIDYSDYIPSLPFINDSEKVKYNVSVPIEGLPSFITQEMIVGALKCQDQTGFPASVTIAQIIQESGYGKYGPGGEEGQGLSYLAYQYNNLFGIKGQGTAGSVSMSTGEQTAAGASYTITAGFRVYNTYTESLEDRTSLLQRVYGDLIEGVTDANTFAMKIGQRWATDVDYGQSLIWQMEKYDLYRLDSMTVGEFSDMIGTFANPCPGALITSNFGFRSFDNSYHKGLDLGTSGENIPTYAAAAGTVVTAGWSNSAGNWVVIDHGNGLVTKYMHHEQIFVEEGQQVEKGQQIGVTGSTGYSTGVHLHFQVEENGTAVDPLTYLVNHNIEGQQ